MEEMVRYLKALLVLQVEALEDKEGGTKVEVLLHRTGLGIKEISDLLGKSYPAVAKAISRSRGSRKVTSRAS